MSNNQRWRYEPDKPRQFAVDTAQVIEVGDFVYLATDDVRAVSQYTYTVLDDTQKKCAAVFVGVAGQASADGETEPIRVMAAGIFEMPCASATFEIGDLVTFDDNSGADALEDQQVIATLDPDGAIGRVVKREASAVTEVMVEIWSAYGDPRLTDSAVDPRVTGHFFDDFEGFTGLDLTRWQVVDVLGATQAALADAHGGLLRLALTNANEAQDAVLYFGDQLSFDIDKTNWFRFLATVAVAPGTDVTLVMGVAGDHNLDKDTVSQHAWFRLDAGLDLLIESDDGTNNNDDKDTLVNIVATEAHLFEIDLRDKSNVKFYMDGAVVVDAAPTTFDMSNYSGGLQPYFSLDKGAVTELGTLDIDWVDVDFDR